jgi:hypothetical protein
VGFLILSCFYDYDSNEHNACVDNDNFFMLVDSVKPDGLLTAFLCLGQIALIIEDTLFVHGAVKEYNVG